MVARLRSAHWLAASYEKSIAWRCQVVAAHADEDLPQLGVGRIAAPALLRFWRMFMTPVARFSLAGRSQQLIDREIVLDYSGKLH